MQCLIRRQKRRRGRGNGLASGSSDDSSSGTSKNNGSNINKCMDGVVATQAANVGQHMAARRSRGLLKLHLQVVAAMAKAQGIRPQAYEKRLVVNFDLLFQRGGRAVFNENFLTNVHDRCQA